MSRRSQPPKPFRESAGSRVLSPITLLAACRWLAGRLAAPTVLAELHAAGGFASDRQDIRVSEDPHWHKPDEKAPKNKLLLVCFSLLVAVAMLSCGKGGDDRGALGEYVSPGDSLSRIRYHDGTVSVNDRCPVLRHRLDLRVLPVYVNQQPVGFCRASCAKAFVGLPEWYLGTLGVEFKCVVDPGRDAVLDPRQKAQVNYEIFFFASPANLQKFVDAPYRYSGKVTDPVSWERFQPTEASPRRNRAGRTFFFSSQSTARRFDRAPDAFVGRDMEKKEAGPR